MIVIRPMKEEDLKQIIEIENRNFAIPWSYESFQDALNNPDNIYLSASENGKIKGYIGLWRILDEGDITNVSVLEEAQNQGIASMLMKHVLKMAVERGIVACTLEVRVGNSKAIHIYKKFGFQEVGIRPGFYEKPREDAMIMWKHNL